MKTRNVLLDLSRLLDVLCIYFWEKVHFQTQTIMLSYQSFFNAYFLSLLVQKKNQSNQLMCWRMEKKKKRWCFCMVALPVTWKCILNVSRNISMSTWMDGPREQGEEEGRSVDVDVDVGPVGGRGCAGWSCYFNASLILLQLWHLGSRKGEKQSQTFHFGQNIFSEMAYESVL